MPARNGWRYWRWGGRGQCWGAEKTEARKMLVNRAESPASSAPSENEHILFPQRNRGAWQYTANWQTHKPYKAVEAHDVAVPRCTLVSGPDDPSIGGGRLGAMTPFRKL